MAWLKEVRSYRPTHCLPRTPTSRTGEASRTLITVCTSTFSCSRFVWSVLTNETLNDAFIQVENLLNGRPLTFVGVDANDPEVLTPNHLLLGRNLPNTAPFIPHDSDVNSRRKWPDSPDNVNVNDIVLLIDANTPRRKCFVCAGIDGIVRSVTVKTETSELERPVVKLCILDRANSNEDAPNDQ